MTEEKDTKPAAMNAFELISLSRGLNLSSLFETHEVIGIPQPGSMRVRLLWPFAGASTRTLVCALDSEGGLWLELRVLNVF